MIEWVFVTGSHYKGGDIGFTYNISNYAISDVDGTFNNFAGDTSATIGFTNEPIYLDIYSAADTDGDDRITIASGDELVMKAIVPSDITTGTITFDLSGSTGDIMSGITWNDRAGQSVQFSWPNITLTVVENQRDYYLYWNPTVSDERSATLNFTVSGNYNLNSVGNTSYSKAITVTPPAETPPVVTHSEFTYNFEDGVEFGGWDTNITTTDIVYDPNDQSNKVLKIVVDDNGYNFGQIGISNGDYSGKYTLSLKYKAETSTGKMNLVFQYEYKDENGENKYTERIKYEEGKEDENVLSTDWKDITWDLNFAEQANQFIIQFEHVPANAVFYIDDLKLVKNNQ